MPKAKVVGLDFGWPEPRHSSVKGASPVAHTPGPWDSSEQNGGKSHCVVAQVWDAKGESLAVVDPTTDPMIATANARLMAAAPDLLEALIYMRRTMYSNESEESIKADAAIAKALGKVVN